MAKRATEILNSEPTTNSVTNSPEPPRPRVLGGSIDVRNRAQSARNKLGLIGGEKSLRITHILMVAPGGIQGCIEALRGDEDLLSAQFLEKYDSISESDLAYLTIEEISLAAEIEPRKLLGIITTALATQAMDTQKLIVAAATPKIIAKTAELAATDIGERDREFFLKHISFLPQPQGVKVNVQNNTVNALPSPAEPAMEQLDARPDAFLLELQSMLRPEQKRIDPPTQAIKVIEAEYLGEGDVR